MVRVAGVVENKWLFSCVSTFFAVVSIIGLSSGVIRGQFLKAWKKMMSLGWEWQVLPLGGVGVLLGTLSICGGCLFFHQRSTLYVVHSVGGLY